MVLLRQSDYNSYGYKEKFFYEPKFQQQHTLENSVIIINCSFYIYPIFEKCLTTILLIHIFSPQFDGHFIALLYISIIFLPFKGNLLHYLLHVEYPLTYPQL